MDSLASSEGAALKGWANSRGLDLLDFDETMELGKKNLWVLIRALSAGINSD